MSSFLNFDTHHPFLNILFSSHFIFRNMKELYVFKRLSWSYGRGKEERANNPSLKDPCGSVFTTDGLELSYRYFCL
jgi:hypothetical protein